MCIICCVLCLALQAPQAALTPAAPAAVAVSSLVGVPGTVSSVKALPAKVNRTVTSEVCPSTPPPEKLIKATNASTSVARKAHTAARPALAKVFRHVGSLQSATSDVVSPARRVR